MDLKKKKILIWDSGSFFETALKLADYFGEVLYFTQWTSGFPGMDKYVIGSEWEKGEMKNSFDGKPLRRVSSFWDSLKEADCVLFCDVYDGDIVEFVRELGYPCAGAGISAELELDRWNTKKLLKSHGMDMNQATRVVGMDSLREHLQKVTDKFIKISRFRKATETFHHDQYFLTKPLLDKMESEAGPMAKIMEFIIEDPIDAIIEEGVDAYSCEGVYPNIILSGIEKKDQGYFGGIIPYDKLSKGIQKTNAQLAPIFKEQKFRGFFSTEVRTTKDNKNYLIDPTIRFPQPPSALYGELFSNLGDIVWGLCNGEVIDVKPTAKFGLYCTLYSDWYDEHHQAIYFPKEYRNNIKLNYPLKVDGEYFCLNINHFPECGAVVTTGTTPEECKEQMEKIAKEIKGYGVSVKVDAISSVIEDYLKMQKDK